MTLKDFAKLTALLVLAPLALSCGDGAGTSVVSLPFGVDNQFVASGYIGDAETPGILTDGNCMMRAPGGDGAGRCHSFSWVAAVNGLGWVGVDWLYPENNFGTSTGITDGKAIAAGAQSISFYAWGANGGESVSFFAGIAGTDTFSVSGGPYTLSTTPTKYYLSLEKATYTKVVMGFGWASNLHNASPTIINVDDIEWSAAPVVGQIPGCTNATAANYNQGATMDDGSCEFSVTFQVDLTSVSPIPSGDAPEIRSTFNGYCDECNPLMAPASGNIWTSTLPLSPGTYGYKYALNSTQAGFEVIPTACAQDPSQSDDDRVRSLTVTAQAQTIPLVKFGMCP